MILASIRFFALAAALLVTFLGPLPASAQNGGLQEASQLFKQGQLDRALDRVNAYLAKTPKDARGRFLKGLILTEQNKPNDAIKVFTALTQEFPELPEPYNNLAVLYASQGQYDKARAALEMAIRTHPSYAIAHENLGDIYAKMASQAYDKALQLDKSNTTAKTKLNLIKELFPAGSPSPKTAAVKPEPPAGVATAAPPSKPIAAAPKQTAKAPEPPAEKAAPPKAPARPAATARNQGEVLQAVNGWAKAWSGNDVAGYLAYYSADFKTPKGEPREKWEAARKTRIAKPRKIQVAVQSPKVVFKDDNRVTVTFRQDYRSNALKVSTTKTLVMVRAGGRWMIEEERVGG